MKKIFIFSSLTLLSTVQIYGMKRDWSSTDMAQPSQQAPQAAAGIDPNHYGPLAISNPDPADANSLMEHISHLPYYTDHQNTRNRIANAIICGKYTRSFAKFATEKNDVPLWELLISYRQLIKKQHKIDVIDTPKNPPLFDTTSIQIASLLVEKGHASISQNVGESGET